MQASLKDWCTRSGGFAGQQKGGASRLYYAHDNIAGTSFFGQFFPKEAPSHLGTPISHQHQGLYW
jgi:hypothetical protein